MTLVCARVCAKVNLWLVIRSRRPDGWHNIETVFHPIDMTDEVAVSETVSRDIEVKMRFARELTTAPAVAENLAFRAANAYRAATGLSVGLHIDILKRIPMSAGLGGGSADAAAVLRLLTDAYGEPRSTSLNEIAAGIGSDVTFFLEAGTALATGRGERLCPLAAPGELNFVLGFSNEGLATRDVYEHYDRMPAPARRITDVMVRALAHGDPEGVAAELHNDLEAPAFDIRPELRVKKQHLLRAGALGACLSGSGPTLFGIARDGAHALEVRDRVRDVFDRVEVTTSARACFERF